MSNLDDMRRLKEEIITSFDERMDTIANIVKSTSAMATSTREMTNRFQLEHKTMGDNLRLKLKNMKKRLNDEEKKRYSVTQREIKQRMIELADLVSPFRHDGSSEFTKSVSEMLNNFRATRLENFNSFMENLQHGVIKIKDEVNTMLNEFQRSHKEMSKNINELLFDFKSNLKDYKNNLSQNEKERFKQAQMEIKDRTNYLDDLFKNVHSMMMEFKNEHSEMTKILKDVISFKGTNTERLHDFNVMMARIKENQQQREQKTLQILTDFNQSHDDMRIKLFDMLFTMKANLKEANDERINLAHEDMNKRLDYINNIKTEIGSMVTMLREESQKVMREWNDLSKIMGQKWQGKKSFEPEIRTIKKEKPVHPSKSVTKEIVESNQSQNGYAEKILAIINENSSNGIRLIDIGNKMNKKWQTLIPYTKSLLENRIIKKEDNLYFPF